MIYGNLYAKKWKRLLRLGAYKLVKKEKIHNAGKNR
jgi:hypothetical protein